LLLSQGLDSRLRGNDGGAVAVFPINAAISNPVIPTNLHLSNGLDSRLRGNDGLEVARNLKKTETANL